jgi:protein PET100
MYYFGVNLDRRFSVPDFWPKPEQSHKIPYEREEIDKEIARLRERRLAARAKRLEMERMEESVEKNSKPEVLEAVKKEAELREGGQGRGLMGWFK